MDSSCLQYALTEAESLEFARRGVGPRARPIREVAA